MEKERSNALEVAT